MRCTSGWDLDSCGIVTARRWILRAAATPGPARITPGFALKAQIDARVHDYWRRREGAGFWKSELKAMLRRHPELAVKAQSDQSRVSFAAPTTAPRRGGRWAKAA